MRYHPIETILLTRLSGTTIGGQFGWGGTQLKRYQLGPKVDSAGIEILR